MPVKRSATVPTVDPIEHVYHPSDGITQSLLSYFLRCPQLLEYRLKGVRTKSTKVWLSTGSIYHDAIQRLYIEYLTHGAEHLDKRAALIAATLAKEKMADPDVDADALDRLDDNLAMLEVLLPAYVKSWASDFSGEKQWREVERVFDVTVNDYRLVGRRDIAARHANKENWIYETKTFSRERGSDTEIMALQMNLQHTMYSVAWEAEYGSPPVGVVRNLIRIPQLRSGNLVERVREDVQVRPEFYFQRIPVQWDDENYANQKNNLLEILANFCTRVLEKHDVYKDPNACLLPFVCPFLELCANGNKMLYTDGGKLFEELQ